jgi:hypothetical protein
VNYDANTNSAILQDDSLAPILTDVTEIRYPPAILNSGAIDPAHRGPENNSLEVVISDGFASSGKPTNRAVLPGAYSVSYRWTYYFSTQCPQ